jgi:hypothetical protein
VGSERSARGASKAKAAASSGSRRSSRSASKSKATKDSDSGSSANYDTSMKRVVVAAINVKALLTMEPVDGQTTCKVTSRAAI